MTSKEIPEVYTIVAIKWIADKMEKGTSWTAIQHQTSKRKGLVQVTFTRHNCGRPKKGKTISDELDELKEKEAID